MQHVTVLLTLALILPTTATPDEGAQEAQVIFEFDSPTEARWRVVNDGVMGGRSEGFQEVKDGVLRFTGTLVTRGGGFTSVRALQSADLQGFGGVELRVRGGGRTFEFEIDDNTQRGWRSVSRRAPFETTADWAWVRIPFEALQATIFGEPVSAPQIDPSKIRGFGIFIADGLDGAFRLEVDAVRAYGQVDG